MKAEARDVQGFGRHGNSCALHAADMRVLTSLNIAIFSKLQRCGPSAAQRAVPVAGNQTTSDHAGGRPEAARSHAATAEAQGRAQALARSFPSSVAARSTCARGKQGIMINTEGVNVDLYIPRKWCAFRPHAGADWCRRSLRVARASAATDRLRCRAVPGRTRLSPPRTTRPSRSTSGSSTRRACTTARSPRSR